MLVIVGGLTADDHQPEHQDAERAVQHVGDDGLEDGRGEVQRGADRIAGEVADEAAADEGGDEEKGRERSHGGAHCKGEASRKLE